MMKWWAIALVALITALDYQNCSPSHVPGGSFSLSSLYPYDVEPVYFENMQVTGVTDAGSGVWKYEFAASVVYIDDPAQDVDVQITIVDEAGAAICPVTNVTVNQGSNNIAIGACSINHRASEAKINLSAKLHSDSGAVQTVKDYDFDLTGLGD